MTKRFATDMDIVLKMLYDIQYTQKRLSDAGKRWEDEWRDLGPDFNTTTVTWTELGSELNKSGGSERPTRTLAFLKEHLQEAGYVKTYWIPDAVEDPNPFDEEGEFHFELTDKGRLFVESGGHKDRYRSRFWNRVWTITKSAAATANAAAVIWFTWAAAQAADADKLKDEQIIQLMQDNGAKDAKIQKLEQAWRDQAFLNLTHQSDSLP